MKNTFMLKSNRRKFMITTIDKQYMNYIILKLLRYRYPDPYKRQGVLYKSQKLITKPGKKGYKHRYF
jgi:ribosomal protein L6P/L9E